MPEKRRRGCEIVADLQHRKTVPCLLPAVPAESASESRKRAAKIPKCCCAFSLWSRLQKRKSRSSDDWCDFRGGTRNETPVTSGAMKPQISTVQAGQQKSRTKCLLVLRQTLSHMFHVWFSNLEEIVFVRATAFKLRPQRNWFGCW